MSGKGCGSPCRWIRDSLFSHCLLEHKYSTNGVACPFYLVLTFINRGGKTVVHYYYNCIIKLKTERLKVKAAIKRVGGNWLTHKASESRFKHTKCV